MLVDEWHIRMCGNMLTVATPCCPAPVSAIMRFFPIRKQSKACPSELLILCDPV